MAIHYPLLLSYNRPEIEGFRDEGFVLPEVESLGVQFCGFFKTALSSREEPCRHHLSIVNSKACFYTRVTQDKLSICRDVVRDEILSIHSHHNFKPNSCQWQGGMLCIQSVVKASFIPTPGPLCCILGYNHLGCNDLTWMTPDTNL